MKRFLKKTGIWIGVILLAILLFGFVLPREVKVSRSITIDAPMDRVFAQVNDLRNWEEWSPWKRMDPMMEMSYSNPPEGQGAFYKWVSKDKRLGSGTMTLAKVVPNEEIVTALHNEDWGDANATFKFGHDGKKVKVTWDMTNDVGAMPWSRYFGAFMKGQMKKMFDQGLEGIKFNAERS